VGQNSGLIQVTGNLAADFHKSTNLTKW